MNIFSEKLKSEKELRDCGLVLTNAWCSRSIFKEGKVKSIHGIGTQVTPQAIVAIQHYFCYTQLFEL
ncbi:MAG TPA: hypothetical protein PLE32_15110, partial [Haliscomenobacter sp.]|nr:hypothetical protein [Haliscomenobacter sp.]